MKSTLLSKDIVVSGQQSFSSSKLFTDNQNGQDFKDSQDLKFQRSSSQALLDRLQDAQNYQTIIKNLNSKVAGLNSELTTMSKEKDILIKELNSYKEANHHLSQMVTELTRENQNMINIIERREQDMRKLHSQNMSTASQSEEKAEVANLKQERDCLMDYCQQLIANLTHWDSLIASKLTKSKQPYQTYTASRGSKETLNLILEDLSYREGDSKWGSKPESPKFGMAVQGYSNLSNKISDMDQKIKELLSPKRSQNGSIKHLSLNSRNIELSRPFGSSLMDDRSPPNIGSNPKLSHILHDETFGGFVAQMGDCLALSQNNQSTILIPFSSTLVNTYLDKPIHQFQSGSIPILQSFGSERHIRGISNCSDLLKEVEPTEAKHLKASRSSQSLKDRLLRQQKAIFNMSSR